MKPLGLTWDFRVMHPTLAEDAIWDAVQTAIIEGITPAQFKREVAEAWEHYLAEEAKHARRELIG